MAGTQKLGIQKHRAVLALGSNLGESEDTLERAIADLVASGVQLVRASGLYRTAPVGGPVLTLPHPRAQERAFVLVPWAQMDPQARLTVTHRAKPSGERADEVPAPLSREVVNVVELSRTPIEADEDAISYMREMQVPDQP